MPKYLITHELHHNGKIFSPGDWVEVSEAAALHLSSCLEGVDELRAELVESDAKKAKS
ncbi:MAG: hypothetical protein JSS26_08385 [Nitrospira sp.]|nr:hypothetical protein [Nitrospira sp.]